MKVSKVIFFLAISWSISGSSFSQNQIKLGDFNELAGFKKGATLLQVKNIWGEPSSEVQYGDYGFAYYDYNNGHMLMIAHYKEKEKIVYGISAYTNQTSNENDLFEYLKTKQIVDSKFSILKLTLTEVLGMFGNPTSQFGPEYKYENETLMVTFTFYDNKCRELALIWRYN